MTEKKTAPRQDAPVQRKFVNTAGEAVAEGATYNGPAVDLNTSHSERSKLAMPYRIAAFVLWALGIMMEVFCFLVIKSVWHLPGNPLTWLIIFLLIDLVLVLIGSQLWKHANHVDPPSKANKFLYWLQTDLGTIVAVIAFMPIIILLLTDKNLDKNTKTVGSIIAVVALAAAAAGGVDYHPVSMEQFDSAEINASMLTDGGKVYWTKSGTVYHFNPECSHLKNSSEVVTGNIKEALNGGKNRACKDCAKAGGSQVLASKKDVTLQSVEDKMSEKGLSMDDLSVSGSTATSTSSTSKDEE